MVNGFREIVDQGADGYVIWGSSKDLNTRAKCQAFRTYLNDILGPTVMESKKIAKHRKNVEQISTTPYEINRESEASSNPEITIINVGWKSKKKIGFPLNWSKNHQCWGLAIWKKILHGTSHAKQSCSKVVDGKGFRSSAVTIIQIKLTCQCTNKQSFFYTNESLSYLTLGVLILFSRVRWNGHIPCVQCER